jgi:hypothetical protein
MNIFKKDGGIGIRLQLTMMWIFVLLNMLYADILSLMDSTSPIRASMAGAPLPPGGLLAGAIVMETALIMLLLSHVLKRNAARLVTVIMAALNVFFVVKGGHGSYYLVFASIEVATLFLIIWTAWKWPKPEVANISTDVASKETYEDSTC